jgi:hypothetical protein
MKTKSMAVALLLLFSTATSFAQESWFDKFSDHKEITQVTVTKAMLNMVSSTTSSVNMNGVNIKDIMSKLDQIDVFTSEEDASRQMMRQEMAAFFKKDKSYEVLMKIRNDNENVSFYGQKEGAFIKSLIMFVDGDDECVIIRLLGKFTTEEIQNVLSDKK